MITFALAAWSGFARRDAQPSARVLLFHGTPRRDAAMLERQLRWLKRRFDIVPLRALVAASAAGEVGRKIALTFDDGLRSNVLVAYPILHKLALPASFFVCPGLVECAGWLWTHEARCRLARLHAPAEVEALVEWMKTLDLESRRRVETRIRAATPGFVPSAAEREACDLADWKELRRLDPALVTIGSHSLSHPILPGMPAEEVEREVAESRRLLEERLERAVDSFAYPDGAFDAATEACARRHYRVALAVEHGVMGRLVAPRGVLRLARRVYA